jgi:hypothetical protein
VVSAVAVVVVAAAVVVVVKFDSICHAEGFGLSLAKGCELITSLTLCIQQHPLKLSAKLQLRISVYGLVYGNGSAACPSWVQGDNRLQVFVNASDKTDWGANEDVAQIKYVVPDTTDFVLVDKLARMK